MQTSRGDAAAETVGETCIFRGDKSPAGFKRCGHCVVCADCYRDLLAAPPKHRKCPLCSAPLELQNGAVHLSSETSEVMKTFVGTNRKQKRAHEADAGKSSRARTLTCT